MEPIIQINLNAIKHNYHKIRETTQKNIIAVIKDNAYGHGLIQIGKLLSSLGVSMLAVSSLQEAMLLRKNMIFSPILLLRRTDNYNVLYSYKITSSIISLAHLKKLIQSNLPLSVHLEINTGMNRLGIELEEIDEALEMIKHSKLQLRGIYTHFCGSNFQTQKEKFLKILPLFDNFKKLIIHAQSSNYINENINEFNAIRIGMALYGYSPYYDLKPSMSLKIPVIRCSHISKDEPVGYDHTEKTKEEGYIITIPWGYSNGLSKFISFEVKHKNIILKRIGKTCMDMMMLFSKSPLNEGEYLNIFSDENLKHLLQINNETIYYAISSLSSTIKREYI